MAEEEKHTSIEWMRQLGKDPLDNPVNVDIKPAWQNKISVKKGNIGERIVQNYLEHRGYVVYKAITEGAHAFDFMAVKGKDTIKIAEVKAKARMDNMHTGINLSNYKEYITVLDKYKMDTFIFFVDEKEKRVYGNYISTLRTEVVVDNVKFPYLRKLQKDKKDVMFFHVATMKDVVRLTEEEVSELKEYTRRSD